MSDVFVSYKAEDRRRIQPLVQALQADGYSVWWDEHIGTGDEWRQTIEHQLDSARCVLVIWSKRSIGPDGHFVRDEATRAQRRHVYVPVLIDAVEPPLGFGERQASSLRGWKGDHSDPRYQAVLAAVTRIAGQRAGGAATGRVARSAVSRRAVIGGGAAATAAIAGIGAWALLKSDSAAASDSIAVLPFANLSGDPSQAYFSDGIAEELRSALARLAGLKVVGRTSSEAVRNDDSGTAAKKLGVANILLGSVRQSPSTIRVSAQLVDGESGLERWSERYDRPPGDAIKIQTDIAENVARALSAALGSAARTAITLGGTTIAAAQRLVLQADQLSYRVDHASDMDRAIALLDAALELDRNYAHAYALKAILLIVKWNRFARNSAELAQGRAEALKYAQTALRIAPNLPIALGALAEYHTSNLEIRPAYDAYKRAFALSSGDPDGLRSYASFLSRVRDSSAAMRLMEQVIVLDPLNSASYSTRAQILYHQRRYNEVERLAAELKRNSPELFRHNQVRGDSLVMLGRIEEARRFYAASPEDDLFRLTGEAVLAARLKDRATAVQKIRRIEQLYGDAASYQYAQVNAQLGDVDQSLAALEHGWQIKDPGMLNVRVDPRLDPLRKDHRFAALVKKMNFPA